MSTAAKHRFEVIRAPDGAPWAVFGAKSEEQQLGAYWCGGFDDLEGLVLAARLLPDTAIFCVRWSRLVLCTPAFAAAIEPRSEMPRGFFVEVLS